MQAVMRVFPSSADGSKICKSHIMDMIESAKIRNGIDEEVIESFLENKQYCTDIVVAKGKAPTPGRDASI